MEVLPLAREAVVAPRDWRISAASLSGLRRKLRRAEGAGVSVAGPEEAPDWPALAEVARDWAASHGSERGFSMGRFDRRYLGHQRIYTARAGGRLLAFASFHDGTEEWVLDLMRHRTDVPDGTMYLLVATAIEDARRLGLPRLSLAAVPETAFPGRMSRAGHLLARLGADGGAGLARFKSAFAPKWERRYLCLPHAALLPLAALELARAIHRPDPLPQAVTAPLGAELSGIDDDHAEYAFASAR
jgi:phosphatidylglycerol lysyltransferase